MCVLSCISSWVSCPISFKGGVPVTWDPWEDWKHGVGKKEKWAGDCLSQQVKKPQQKTNTDGSCARSLEPVACAEHEEKLIYNIRKRQILRMSQTLGRCFPSAERERAALCVTEPLQTEANLEARTHPARAQCARKNLVYNPSIFHSLIYSHLSLAENFSEIWHC